MGTLSLGWYGCDGINGPEPISSSPQSLLSISRGSSVDVRQTSGFLARKNAGITSVDDLFAEVYAIHPTFAGGYLNGDELVLNVAGLPDLGLPDLGLASALLGTINEVSGSQLPSAQSVRLEVVNYTWGELSLVMEQTMALVDDAALYDIDERRNRIVVEALDESDRAGYLELLEPLGEYLPAVSINIAPERTLAQVTGGLPIGDPGGEGNGNSRINSGSLRQLANPIPGGVQIQYYNNAAAGIGSGTLGFNVYRGSTLGFVTNTHLSNTYFGYDNTNYYQSTYGSSIDKVGVESYDPALFYGTDGGYCRRNWSCRWSDATFVGYDSGYSGGFDVIGDIAKPNSSGGNSAPGTLLFNNYWEIYDYARYTWSGQPVSKVGRSTGWTDGVVDRTSFVLNYHNFAPSEVPVSTYLLSQDSFTGFAGQGDSGSPVFTDDDCDETFIIGCNNNSFNPNTQRRLVGILYIVPGPGESGTQGEVIYSPLSNISIDIAPNGLSFDYTF